MDASQGAFFREPVRPPPGPARLSRPMAPSEGELRKLARRVVGRVLAERGVETTGARPAGVTVTVNSAAPRPDAGERSRGSSGSTGRGPAVVSARCLAKTPDGGRFVAPEGAVLTPLAREEAHRRGIEITTGRAGHASADLAGGGGARRLRVAVGSDHGGFEMKLEVLRWVGECGHVAVDLGTRDEAPVDYPDFAAAVAQAVAGGQCDVGIVVDGAGIGSAMAANKVPGVRAAVCWDEASAKNAREHNYANVLTLGGRMLPFELACRVVRTFLATEWGEARHGRRVDKITALERRYARLPRTPEAHR